MTQKISNVNWNEALPSAAKAGDNTKRARQKSGSQTLASFSKIVSTGSSTALLGLSTNHSMRRPCNSTDQGTHRTGRQCAYLQHTVL
jgi:hypothetical protein